MPCFLSVSRHLFLPPSREFFTLPSPSPIAACPSCRTSLLSVHAPLWQRCRSSELLAQQPGRPRVPVPFIKVLLAPTRPLRSGALQERGREGTKELKSPQSRVVPCGLTTPLPCPTCFWSAQLPGGAVPASCQNSRVRSEVIPHPFPRS
jgi:hypothetical protein